MSTFKTFGWSIATLLLLGSSAYLFYDGIDSSHSGETTHTLGHETAPYVIAAVCLLLGCYTLWRAMWSASGYSKLVDTDSTTSSAPPSPPLTASAPPSNAGSENGDSPRSSPSKPPSNNSINSGGSIVGSVTNSMLAKFHLTLHAAWGAVGGSPAKTPPPPHIGIVGGESDADTKNTI